jgi:uncharacterized protein YcaQ
MLARGWPVPASAPLQPDLLEFMVARGEVAIAGRRGGDRLWDLATRVYPDDPVVPRDEALPADRL